MLRLTFNSTDTQLAAAIRAKSEAITEALVNKITFLMVELQKKIQTEKLQGQVLHHRTGKLIASVVAHPAVIEGKTIIATVTAAGGPAWYGMVHEKGGTRMYEIAPVTKKALAFFPGGTLGGGGGLVPVNKQTLASMYSGGSLRATARTLSKFSGLGGVVVKKVIHPPLPRRSFMATALEESITHIKQELAKAVGQALRRPKGGTS